MTLSRACLFPLFLTALALAETGCSSDDTSPPPEKVEQISTYQRVAIWSNLLERYPDLPRKIEAVLGEKGRPAESNNQGQAVEIYLHTQEGTVALAAGRIDIFVTDMSRESLRELHKFLLTVPQEARRLGIGQHASLAPPSDSSRPRVLFLGADGRIEVKGPSGQTTQTISLYHNEFAKAAHLQVHAFSQAGEDAVPAITEYLKDAGIVRGPPDAEVKAGHIGKPPPERLVIVAIGEIKNLDIEGPREKATQKVEVEAKVSGQVAAHSETARVAEVGRSSHSAKVAVVAAVAAAVAARKSSSSSGTSGGSGGYRTVRRVRR